MWNLSNVSIAFTGSIWLGFVWFFITFRIVPYFFIHSTNLLGFLKTWKEGAKAAYIGNFVFNQKYVSESAETNQVRGMFLL